MLRMGLLVGLGIRMWDWVVVVGSGELAVLLSLPLFALECWPLARSLAFIWKHTLPRKTKTTPTLILSFLSLSLSLSLSQSNDEKEIDATRRRRRRRQQQQHLERRSSVGRSAFLPPSERDAYVFPLGQQRRSVRVRQCVTGAFAYVYAQQHLTHASSSSLVTPFLGSNKLTGGP